MAILSVLMKHLNIQFPIVLAIASSSIGWGIMRVEAQSNTTCSRASIVRIDGIDATFVRNGFRFDAYRGANLCIDDVLVAEDNTIVRVRCEGDLSDIQRRVNGALSVREICGASSGTVSSNPLGTNPLDANPLKVQSSIPFTPPSFSPSAPSSPSTLYSPGTSFLSPAGTSIFSTPELSAPTAPAYNPPPLLESYRPQIQERSIGYTPIESCREFSELPGSNDGTLASLPTPAIPSYTGTPWETGYSMTHSSNVTCSNQR